MITRATALPFTLKQQEVARASEGSPPAGHASGSRAPVPEPTRPAAQSSTGARRIAGGVPQPAKA
ncbi:MAG: hypothetical protein ACTS8S_13500 [Giesbergeria sp.]